MRRPWLQIYEGLAIAMVLFTSLANPAVSVGAALVLLLIGLAAFPDLRRSGTLAAAAGIVIALALAALIWR